VFRNENEFEDTFVNELIERGWDEKVFEYKTEEDLWKNWADIICNNSANKVKDRLNGYPLIPEEIDQIKELIAQKKTPYELNKLINGKTISIKRQNKDDIEHFGKEISLSIFDRGDVCGGYSKYQIARQTRHSAKDDISRSKRSDITLLINGMPLIHIELKNTGVPIVQACWQIREYHKEGVFTGLFAMVQIFVAMTPEEHLYFANVSDYNKISKKAMFSWADFNNNSLFNIENSGKNKNENWKKVIEYLLSIPMAHQLIGYYTVADSSDESLKVFRSYQYFAVEQIVKRVNDAQWTENDKLGGYIWHTTGSGKTMTSFKAGQRLSYSKKCDKIVFLMDRIELGTQSFEEYKNFTNDDEDIQETEDSAILCNKLKSNNHSDIMIVTSIHKMSKIANGDEHFKKKDLETIKAKKIVFIVDECHRTTFGDMLSDIKKKFPRALYFGFTGTPIFDEHKKNGVEQSDIIGDELHRYSISDGIRDGNVLGFDTCKVLTFKDKDLKRQIALQHAGAKTEEELKRNSEKMKIYQSYMNRDMVEIEKEIPVSQYILPEHQEQVVDSILQDWNATSSFGKFHAILATSSISEACDYYQIFQNKIAENKKRGGTQIKVTCLFDPNLEFNEKCEKKEDSLKDIIRDYNQMFNKTYKIATHADFKKDISQRLAHKGKYLNIKQENQLDLLIVVDQMLTGYDSKWLNALYLDKELKYEQIVQAFSRTNRIGKEEKTHGIIKYYRRPHTMQQNIIKAFKLYSGEQARGVFVDKLKDNVKKINQNFIQIKELFEKEEIPNFSKLPREEAERMKFASLFIKLKKIIDSAKLQGFNWNDAGDIKLELDEKTFLILAIRYKELIIEGSKGGSMKIPPYEIDPTCIEIQTEKIDVNYINEKFKKFIIDLAEYGENSDKIEELYKQMSREFGALKGEEQEEAEKILIDLRSGKLIDTTKTFRELLNEYLKNKEDDLIKRFADSLGLNEGMLRKLVEGRPSKKQLNDGRLDPLIEDFQKHTEVAYEYCREKNLQIKPHMLVIWVTNQVKDFISSGGFEIN